MHTAGASLLFGLSIPTDAGPGADPVSAAQAAEERGFDFVSINDHIHGPGPRVEAWTTLCWIAASTSRVRVATRVLGVPYRHPAIVAKMGETLDRLSRGRLILGLGAGSAEDEFRALGLGVAPLRERMQGLEEAIQIVRGLWTAPSSTFAGDVYRVEAAQLEPKPAHRIPIWLGAHGRRGLDLTGRLADGWIPSMASAPPADVASLIAMVRGAARDAGRDPRDVTCIYNLEVSLGEQRDSGDHVLSGGPAEVAERLVGLSKLGFDGFNLTPTGPMPERQIALLGSDVLPVVRAAV